MAAEKLKRRKSPGIYQIPLELIKARGMTVCCDVQKLSVFGMKRNFLNSRRSQLLYVLTRRVMKPMYYCCQLRTKFYPAPSIKVN